MASLHLNLDFIWEYNKLIAWLGHTGKASLNLDDVGNPVEQWGDWEQNKIRDFLILARIPVIVKVICYVPRGVDANIANFGHRQHIHDTIYFSVLR